MAKNIAEQLIGTLEKAGVKRVYAGMGESLNHISNAVSKNGKVQWVRMQHEETAAYAAGAEAQLTGRLACCMGASGAGHVHLINGLYDAQRSGAPVLAIASMPSADMHGSRFFQETSPIKLFDDCSTFNQVAATPKQFPKMLQIALQTAVSSHGVSVLGVPRDLTMESSDEYMSINQPQYTNPLVSPSAVEIEEFAALLNSAKKITVFCGVGAKDAHEEIVELSERLYAPVVYTFKSKMEFQYDNPYEVGMSGLLGSPSGYDSMHEAELLLLLGTDFPLDSFMPQKSGVIQIDADPTRLGRRTKLQLGLCGDIRATLQAVMPLVSQKEEFDFLEHQLRKYRKVQKHLSASAKKKGKSDAIAPEYAITMVDKLAADDAIFTVDTGMTCVWAARYLQATGKRSMLGSFNYGGTGNAIPQAIGAALAFPDRQVIALCNDGGFSTLMDGLATIAQYHLPVKMIVFNNRSQGRIRLGMDAVDVSEFTTYNPNLVQLANAMGISAVNVTEPEEVLSALTHALEAERPMLVNLMIDPAALVMPSNVKFTQMLSLAQSMYKMMLEGRTEELIDTVDSNIKHIREVF